MISSPEWKIHCLPIGSAPDENRYRKVRAYFTEKYVGVAIEN
jgi:hypothetical protein